MGPFFALGDALGLPRLARRSGCGSALCSRSRAWGVVRLLDALVGRPRGAAHLAGGLLYMLNPYVVVYRARTSITLLGYAALPWLLLCVHRGLRDAARLVVAGGVRARADRDRRRRERGGDRVGAARARRCCVVYELGWGGVARGARRARSRCGSSPVAALASLWWVAAVLVQARYGLDFLPFTEQPGTIWSTTSLPESLRLMGFWTSYVGVGYGGALRAVPGRRRRAAVLAPVVLAALLVPALRARRFALDAALRATRRSSCAGARRPARDVAGFPEGTPLRRAATFTYNHVAGRAVPAHDLQGGAAGGARRSPASARWRVRRAAARGCAPWRSSARRRSSRSRAGRWCAASALDRQLELPHGVPAAWRDAAHDLDRTLPRRPARGGPARPAVRLLRLGRDDRPDPARADRPPGGDALHRPVRRPARDRPAVDDRRARQQQRALPGPAAAAARPDGRRRRRAGRRRRPLAQRRRPGRRGGRRPRARSAPPAARLRAARARCPARPGRSSRPRALPQVRRWNVPHRRAWCACCPATGATVVDGSAPAHRRPRRLRRAADRPRAALRGRPRRRRAARPGGARGVVRHQRLQPPARLRRRAPARQHGLDRARRRDALRGRRGARPVPAPRHRRADRRGLRRRRARSRADFSPGFAAVPRAPAVRRARRRPVDRVAGRPRAGHRSPPPRRRASRRRATSTTSTCCPTATARVASTASAVNGREFAVHAAGTGCRSACAACAR